MDIENINNFKEEYYVGIACAKVAIRDLLERSIPITPAIIWYEMISPFEQYNERELLKKADRII